MSVALVKIQVRNDTAQAWAAANPYLSDGEPGAESNTGRLKIGNGVDRWLDLPYVGGDGSGGGGTNPIAGNLDGGIYTGNPRTADAGPPIQPAASYAYVENSRVFVSSWSPAYVDDPSTTAIEYYEVQVTQTPTDESSWIPCGFSNGSAEEVKNFAIVNAPQLTDPSGSYWYRVKAVLDTGGLGEWGYTPEFRHFREPQNIDFDLTVVPVTNEIGSTGEDNVTVITVENFSGDYTGSPTWTYPAVTGLVYTEDNAGGNPLLRIENTQGILTVEQTLIIQCTYAGNYSESGSDDNSFIVSKSVTIVLKNTSDDPGPGPGPGPTPGDTLPLFSWELVEDAEVAPPVPINSRTEATIVRRDCDGNNCNRWYPCATADGCVECEVPYCTPMAFSDFTILWTSPHRTEASVGGIPNAETQYKKLLIGGSGGSCTNDPMLLSSGGELKIPNPIINIATESSGNPDGGLKLTTYTGAYEKFDKLSLNGAVATYAVLYPNEKGLSQDSVFYGMSATGCIVMTRDEGSTFNFVDPFSNGFTYFHWNSSGGGEVEAQRLSNEAGMPKLLAKGKSITNGREVLIGLYDRVTGNNPISQWYYTDDHITWYPTTNVDRLPDSTTNFWYDEATNTTYATDEEHTGEAVNGTYSYYKSGAGAQPQPPVAPTFNWQLVIGSSTEPPGLGNTDLGSGTTGRPPANFGNDLITGEPQDPYKWPAGYFPASTFPIAECPSAGTPGMPPDCMALYPWMEEIDQLTTPKQYKNKTLCGVNFYIHIRLAVANLLLTYPNGTGNGDSVSGDKAICFQSPAGNVGVECQASPIQIRIPTGSFDETELVNLALSNPLYTQIQRYTYFQDADGNDVVLDATVEQIAGAYQYLQDVEVGGVTATYLMLTPRLIEWEDEDGETVTEQFTGCLIVTRDGGVTWDYVSPQGLGTRQINPAEIDSWFVTTDFQDPGNAEYHYPTMLSRCWSHMYDRFVVVALFRKNGVMSGGVENLSIDQFYYTPDNKTWYPCDEADGTPWPLVNGYDQQPTKLWTDSETGHSYCVDPTNNGLLDETGVCSYWKSVRG